jgi:hypothetical protein
MTFTPTDPHPEFAGMTPKQAIKRLKAGGLDNDAIDAAFDSVFSEPFDPENEDHAYFYRWVKVAKDTLKVEEKAKVEAEAYNEAEGFKKAGRKYFKDQGIDPDTVGEEALVEIGRLIVNPPTVSDEVEHTEEMTLVRRDEETMCLVTPDGNIVGLIDSPTFGPDERERELQWLGEKLTQLKAKKTGIEAERDVWLKKIDGTYRPQINTLDRVMKYLQYRYTPMAESYMRELYEETKDTKKPILSAKVGLLHLALKAKRESVSVIMESKAVIWLRRHKIFGAIKVEESVLKSQIPADVKALMNDSPDCGMEYQPGGEREFTMQ